MATNQFFQNYNYFEEQQLLDDLTVELIQIHGVDTFYVARKSDQFDEVLNEDDVTVFNAVYEMEMYVKSVDGFQGEGDFLSKFGLTIRDQVTFTVAMRTFEKYATRNDPLLKRPKEGDLVFMPMNKKFFKITFVEHESVFYQAGALQVFDLRCELLEYSNERFETGNYEIDHYHDNFKTIEIETLEDLSDLDPIAKNIFFEDEMDDVLDFSEKNPFTDEITFPTKR